MNITENTHAKKYNIYASKIKETILKIAGIYKSLGYKIPDFSVKIMETAEAGNDDGNRNRNTEVSFVADNSGKLTLYIDVGTARIMSRNADIAEKYLAHEIAHIITPDDKTHKEKFNETVQKYNKATGKNIYSLYDKSTSPEDEDEFNTQNFGKNFNDKMNAELGNFGKKYQKRLTDIYNLPYNIKAGNSKIDAQFDISLKESFFNY